MSFRWRGLLAGGICLLGLVWGALGIHAATSEASAATATLLRVDHHSSRALALVNDARAAQRAYVAWGPQTRDWEADVSAAIVDATRELDQLQALVHSASAQGDLDAAKASLQAFVQVDEQARARLRDSMRTETAGLIFSEGSTAATSVLDHLKAATESLRSDANVAVTAAHREVLVAAVTCGSLVLVALVLLLLPSRAARDRHVIDDLVSIDLRDSSWRRTSPSDTTFPQGPPASSSAMVLHSMFPSTSDALPVMPPDLVINWLAVGEICADFARITETRDVKPLLDKAMGLLDADALVVWIGEPGNRQLRPVVILGSEPSASRLANLSIDLYNATLTAFRTGSLQIVGSSPTKPGAVVSPLVTAAGCMGVIAVELRDGRERSPGTCAVARIIAAQLSALLGTEPVAAGSTGAEAV